MSERAVPVDPLIELRRDLHRYPEPAWREFATTARVVEEVERIGVDELYVGREVLSGEREALPDDEEIDHLTGSTANLQTSIGAGRHEDFTSNGIDAFGALSTRVRSSVDLDPQATADTRLRDVLGARGEGVKKGSVQVTVNGATADVDLSTADTMGDVVTRINAATRQHDVSYSQFMGQYRKSDLDMNRKVLADLAVHDPDAFKQIVDDARLAAQRLVVGLPDQEHARRRETVRRRDLEAA